LHKREGKAITNFQKTLPAPHSDMAHNHSKIPMFSIFNVHQDHVEYDIEQGMIDHVQKLLLELGKGFLLSDVNTM